MKYQVCLWLCLATLTTVTAVYYSTFPEIALLQQYIRINTTSGGDLQPAVAFWKKLAAAQNVSIVELQYKEGCPILILKWPGCDPSLQSLLLNSHMDVVPAYESDGWRYPPFSGYITTNDIWGRGTQDMKSVSLQHFEALSRLKARGEKLARTVYMSLMPDEEVGAECGMIPFLKSKEFAALNVAVEFDEGAPFPVPFIPVFYQDKVVWQIQVDCYGVAAHGSTFPPTNETATGKCRNVIDTLFKFRDEQYEIALTAPFYDAGVYTSVNLNKMNGGIANNIIPGHVTLLFDIRLGTRVNEETLGNQLNQWIRAAGPNVTLTYILKNAQSPATVISDKNPYWVAITEVANELGLTMTPVVAAGSTDARFVRAARIPAFGISPMPNTELLLHTVNEHLPLEKFLDGIKIFECLIKAIANLSQDVTGTDPSIYVHDTNTAKYDF